MPPETTVAPQQTDPQQIITAPANMTNTTATAQPGQVVWSQPNGQPPANGPFFTSEDLAKARKEEKDKIYADIAKVKSDLKEAQAQLAKREAAEKEALAKEEEAKRKAAEEEMSLRELLQKRDQEFQQWRQQMEHERDLERAAMEKERQFAQLQSYIHKRVSEERESDGIAPELLDLIGGNTVEEVEACIQMLRAKTEQIVTNISASRAGQAPPRGVTPAGYSTTGPMDTQAGTKTYNREDIRDMPMSEWANLRSKVLPGASRQSDQGLFG